MVARNSQARAKLSSQTRRLVQQLDPRRDHRRRRASPVPDLASLEVERIGGRVDGRRLRRRRERPSGRPRPHRRSRPAVRRRPSSRSDRSDHSTSSRPSTRSGWLRSALCHCALFDRRARGSPSKPAPRGRPCRDRGTGSSSRDRSPSVPRPGPRSAGSPRHRRRSRPSRRRRRGCQLEHGQQGPAGPAACDWRPSPGTLVNQIADTGQHFRQPGASAPDPSR